MDLLIHRANGIHRAKQEWTTVSPSTVWGVNTGYTECVCVCVYKSSSAFTEAEKYQRWESNKSFIITTGNLRHKLVNTLFQPC